MAKNCILMMLRKWVEGFEWWLSERVLNLELLGLADWCWDGDECFVGWQADIYIKLTALLSPRPSEVVDQGDVDG